MKTQQHPHSAPDSTGSEPTMPSAEQSLLSRVIAPEQPSGQGISRYTLYSEAPSERDPEFVHIEDIPSRARLFNWEINVHTHPNMFQVVFVQSGQVRILIDGREETRYGPVMISVPPGVVHGFEFEREATVGWVITVSQLLMMDDQLSRQFAFSQPLLEKPNITSLPQDQQLEFINQTVAQLEHEYHSDAVGKQSMFVWLLFSLLTRLGRVIQQIPDSAPQDLHTERFRRLNQLIDEHYRQHHPVEFYADLLLTTPASLSRTCKQVAGKNITDLIYDRMILEAQRLLIYSSVPVSLIGYELGFNDPAYFSRFFRRRVGLSPSEFREQRERK
ncbi:helix-turn-helix domain-containing protein [Oceanobacter kriegii]|uniref:helix-turn-helix domain-containing protein n=1 Tax=Oceanobacter kriegii TaxID=64972 RepID=UPI0009FD0F22|nr:helix-turn-helix domain-containing protein [Oceanobacter kriegii]